jgi:ribosomal protein L11 methyltransferase
MNKTAYKNKEAGGNPSPSAAPYQNLHIYYLQGRLTPDDDLLGGNFIGNWEEEGFSFLFFSSPAHERVEAVLSRQPELILLDQFHMTYEEWQGGRLAPFEIGNFLILPPWEKGSESQTQSPGLEIVLDPGVVFGTGTHPTTHDCLEILEQLCREHAVGSVLDLGTGTGLLALAAARLGCNSALALDFNFLAAKTAKRNIELNGLEDKILAFQGRAEDFIAYPADLVIANIHYDVMKELVAAEGFLSKKWFILSGLLRTEARDIAYKLSRLPVNILKTRERDGVWHTFFGEISA